MGKIAFVFPGQGSQYVGMGQALAEAYPAARRRLEEAGEALGMDLMRLLFEGPEDALAETENTQPAILAVSVACLEVLRQEGLEPEVAAGLSLGEYSALVAAGALEFATAVQVVRQRGRFMQDAVPLGVGGMAAILGLDTVVVEAICEQARGVGWVEPANYNCPGQVVVAGEVAAVDRAVQLAKEAGAARAVKLAVSAPFHTRMLAPAADRLAEVLAAVPIRPARIPVVANVTAEPVQDPEEIRTLLIRQVASPVRWEQSVRRMVADGVDTFVEVGPGRALSGFIKRIDRRLKVFNVEDPQTLAGALDSLGRVW
ncbi:ACP S-malonyltransferase [Caldinitratiruptor microaerophilus]|uniref:Malonyl CoA-acyl carrier protein transacylase n=1 Tax=Caldinitratiruptor microaerophilus TaxID=671077 RepID=A0AA35CLH9_9FIRM|nr:ACP S-malonyltransferase [Caldinitratiruptor microaerophilus]BDG60613.1 malonyl CoA-acyl carrier protein transacylase [Caldinitratiruptor microaerophilus]